MPNSGQRGPRKIVYVYTLKPFGAEPEDLLFFYVTTIPVRPVLEYACPVWHSSLTVAQTKALESLQQTAMTIIFPDKDYLLSVIVASADTLESRRQQLSGSSEGAFYGNRPVYTNYSRTNGTIKTCSRNRTTLQRLLPSTVCYMVAMKFCYTHCQNIINSDDTISRSRTLTGCRILAIVVRMNLFYSP